MAVVRVVHDARDALDSTRGDGDPFPSAGGSGFGLDRGHGLHPVALDDDVGRMHASPGVALRCAIAREGFGAAPVPVPDEIGLDVDGREMKNRVRVFEMARFAQPAGDLQQQAARRG